MTVLIILGILFLATCIFFLGFIPGALLGNSRNYPVYSSEEREELIVTLRDLLTDSMAVFYKVPTSLTKTIEEYYKDEIELLNKYLDENWEIPK